MLKSWNCVCKHNWAGGGVKKSDIRTETNPIHKSKCLFIFSLPFWDLGVLREKLWFQAPSKKKPTQDLEIRTKTFLTILYKLQTTSVFFVEKRDFKVLNEKSTGQRLILKILFHNQYWKKVRDWDTDTMIGIKKSAEPVFKWLSQQEDDLRSIVAMPAPAPGNPDQLNRIKTHF